MKKLINSPETVVKDALAGMALAHPDLIKVHYDPDFIVRADAPVKGKVGIISGGGSGHGYKMGPAVGELLARQVLEDAPSDPSFAIGRFEHDLSIRRPSSTSKSHLD